MTWKSMLNVRWHHVEGGGGGMILPDANLLLHAFNSDSADHATTGRWIQDLLEGGKEVCLCAVVLFCLREDQYASEGFPPPSHG